MKGRALSLTQPWATLVAIGAKRIETRSWSTAYRGPVAIHAAKEFPAIARELCCRRHFAGALAEAGYNHPSELPLGAILAVGHLVAVERVEAERNPFADAAFFSERERAFGDYTAGRYAWRLDRVVRLADPIPCKGSLGLWTLVDDVASHVLASLAAIKSRRRADEARP